MSTSVCPQVRDSSRNYLAGLMRIASWRHGLQERSPSICIATQGQFPGAEIVSAHCCHRAYLEQYFVASGLRRISRYLVHRNSARLEEKAFRRARVITVPSQGLLREISEYYPFARASSFLFPTSSTLSGMRRTVTSIALRREGSWAFLPTTSSSFLVALGNFAHKGLELAMRALAMLGQGASPRPSSSSEERKVRSTFIAASLPSSGCSAVSSSSGIDRTCVRTSGPRTHSYFPRSTSRSPSRPSGSRRGPAGDRHPRPRRRRPDRTRLEWLGCATHAGGICRGDERRPRLTGTAARNGSQGTECRKEARSPALRRAVA